MLIVANRDQRSSAYSGGGGSNKNLCPGCCTVVDSLPFGEICRPCANLSIEGGKLLQSSAYPCYFVPEQSAALQKDYVDLVARQIALAFGRGGPNNEKPLTKGQMRDFFSEVRRLAAVVARVPESERKLDPTALATLKAHAIYRLNKRSVPASFKSFIDRNVDSVLNLNTVAALRAFEQHFEAVVAYSEGVLKERER